MINVALIFTSVMGGMIIALNIVEEKTDNTISAMNLSPVSRLGFIAGIELLGDKWQPLFYWVPFYWTYKGNNLVLSNSGSWIDIIKYSGIVLGISLIVFIVLMPRIRKGLE